MCDGPAISEVHNLTSIQRFFLEPAAPRQRQFEALRAYVVEGLASAKVAARFGYRTGSFHMLCHAFRCDPDPQFFATPCAGPRAPRRVRPSHAGMRSLLRTKNHAVYEITTS